MKTFSSLAAVMALWLGVSFLLWLAYRIFRRRDGSKQIRVIGGALGLVGEAGPVYSTIRTRASSSAAAQGNYRFRAGSPEEVLREDVRALLNAIEAQSAYFERVNAAKKKIQQTFAVPDFRALSEILQIRRDLWAASEIFLMDGICELGPEFADAKAFESFQAEARSLLFEDRDARAAENAASDPVELRLAIAREEAFAFKAQAESAIAAELEKSRFPTAAELLAVPLSLIKGAVIALREARYLLGDAATTAQSLVRAVTSKGLKGAAEELRRTRTAMPEQFAAAFERAGGLARQGGQSLKRHYEFVIEAQELRARYAELLARAPDLTEKGKQFLARLELERRAEQFRETSGGLVDQARQVLVMAIAYLIAGLQVVQAKITPAEHKRLAPLGASGSAAARDAAPAKTEKPLRVLLLPASAYSGGNLGQADLKGKTRSQKPVPKTKGANRAKPSVAYSEDLKKTSFKELLAEAPKEPEERRETLEPSRGAAGSKKSARRASLLDRLASLEVQAPEDRKR